MALTASLLLSAASAEERRQPPTAPPQKFNAILCKTKSQAIAFASSLASGKTEPMAIDRVNKAAGSEVCGRYMGTAVVEVQTTANHQGGLSCSRVCASSRTVRLPGLQAGSRRSRAALLERGDLAMGVQIPPILVLIVCKTIIAGPPDQNAAFHPFGRISNGRRSTR